MKKILLLTVALAAFISANAQKMLEDNPEIRVGKLENGLTYYLAHNEKPAGCAHFYIVHNVGALQEEDNQNGLAHFLEHMAFNGTKNYPGKSILDFLAKDGVRFGYNVNAYTSVCETCYILSDIPLVRESFVDSVMTILHDWSCNISCEQDALDAERGVISEEWRRGDNTLSRISTAQVNLIYKGSKYTERDVIGKYEIINGFKRHEILDFYEKWYRPDLQAVIIVGDFDVDNMEQKVRKLYSTIPVGSDLTPKEEYPIPAMTEPLFENIIDPEVKYQALKVFHRLPYPAREERYSTDFYSQYFIKQILTSVVYGRLTKATEDPACPAEIAITVTHPYMDNFYTTLFTMTPKSEDQLEGLLRFYATETQRLLKHGFTKEEFDMAKATVWKENRLDEEMDRSDIENDQIVNLCVENFVRAKPMIYEHDLLKIKADVLSDVTYEETLAYMPEMMGGIEKVYSYTVATDKTHLLPSKERMQEVIAEVENSELEPGYIEFKKMNLVQDMKAGSIKKTKELKNMKGELWSLACAVLFAVQMMVVDRFARSSDLLVMSVSQLFTCALVGAPLMFLLPSETARLSLGAVMDAAVPLVYCGVFSSGIAYTLQNVAQSRTGASVAAIVLSTESVFGALSGWIVLHDVLSVGQFCGCALVFMAVVATQLLAARKTSL